MAPLAVVIRTTTLNGSSFPLPRSPNPSSPSSFSSSSVGDTVINIVFGIVACIIGVITIWQAHHAWHHWHQNNVDSRAHGHSPDQTSNGMPLQSHSGTTNIAADMPHSPSIPAADTIAHGQPSQVTPPNSTLPERPGIQVPQTSLAHMPDSRPLSTNTDNGATLVPGAAGQEHR